jgi:hypothetical protein
MTSEIRVSLTFIFTLLLGILSNGLVNSITGHDVVYWSRMFRHEECYAIMAGLSLTIILLYISAGADTAFQNEVRAKFDALLSNASPDNKISERSFSMSDAARIVYDTLDKNTKKDLDGAFERLKSEKPYDIVFDRNIQKVRSKNDYDFIVRVGSLRLFIELKLKDGQVIVKAIQERP